jgi:regulator of RNase E activity RraA
MTPVVGDPISATRDHWRLVDAAASDSVLVIATSAGSFTVLGGVAATVAAARGVSGVITDGAIRDLDEIADCGLAVRFASINPRSCRGEYVVTAIGQPVNFAALTVYPGDLIIADRDGVVAIPASVAESVLNRAQEIEEREKIWASLARQRGSIAEGYAEACRTIGSPH